MKPNLLTNHSWWQPALWKSGDALYNEVAFGASGKELYLGVRIGSFVSQTGRQSISALTKFGQQPEFEHVAHIANIKVGVF